MTTLRPGPRSASEHSGERVEVALLDMSGVIVEVNAAWREFSQGNGGDSARTGVGVSYLAICDAVAADPTARLTAEAIRAAVDGDLPAPRRLVIPCHSRAEHRWYDVVISPRQDPDGVRVGATVTLSRVERPRPLGATGASGGPPPAGDLALNAELLLRVLEEGPDGQLLVDEAGSMVYVNRQLEVLTGYSRSELIGRPVELLVPQPLRSGHVGLRAGFAAVPRMRPMGSGLELSLRLRDGTALPVEIGLAPLEVAGQVLTAASVRDVRTHRTADRHRRRMVQLLSMVPDAVLIADGPGLRVSYANRAASELFGHPGNEMIGRPCAELMPGLVGVDRESTLAVIEAHGGSTVGECRLRTADGRLLPGESHVQLVEPVDATASGPSVVVVVRDISDRLAQGERLRLSEESFRAAFERAPIGMAITRVDPDGHRTIVRANDALGDMLAQPSQGLVGADFGEFSDPADAEVDQAAATAMAAGERSVYARHKRYRRRDGAEVWVEMRTSRVDFPDETGTTALAHMVDVTERHEAERQQEVQRRVAELVSEVTRSVLAAVPRPSIYRSVVDGIARVFTAENVTLAVPAEPGGPLQVVAAVGPGSTALLTGEIPINPDVIELLSRRDRTVLTEPPLVLDPQLRARLGPVAAVWFGSTPTSGGLMSVVRPRGGVPFTRAEVDLLSIVTRQLAVAVELGRAHADQERLAVLEDRQRIARDLHDTVIQDLISLGMLLHRSAERVSDPELADHQHELVTITEQAVRRVRGAVFQLRDEPAGQSLTASVEAITADAARALGHTPSLTLTGPVDDVPAGMGEHVTAVLREALSNVARHAEASTTAVALDLVDGQLRLTVEDDGRGVPSTITNGHGLTNIRHRASALAGETSLQPLAAGGTRLMWLCPLP